MRWQVARLVAKRPETPSAATLHFELAAPPGGPAGIWPGHRAGQHVDVRLTADDGYQAERSYSIASTPEDPGIDLTVEGLDGGEVSPYLVGEMEPGDVLELRGPVGGWFVWDADEGGPLLLVGGGSGVVPLMAMLRHRRRRGSRVPARLLLSVRTAADVFYNDELRAMAAEDDAFELFVTITRGAPEGWAGLTGRIDKEMLASVAPPVAEGARTFVCGPAEFVETASNLLVDLGYPPELVKAERFGPTGS